MIQEIGPEKLDNQYEKRRPEAQDKIIVCREGKYLLTQKEEKIEFLNYSLFHEKPFCRFLFKVSGQSYFLYEGRNLPKEESFVWVDRTFFRQNKMDKAARFAGMTAGHFLNFYRTNQYCGKCGAKTVHSKKERMMQCPRCGHRMYPKINPAVIVAITDGNRLLMTKYKDNPQGKWILVAGFAEIGETLEETCIREVQEETGVKIKNIRYYKSQPWGYSDSLLSGFFAEVEGDITLNVDKNELSMASWIERENIESVDEDFSLTNDMVMAFKDKRF